MGHTVEIPFVCKLAKWVVKMTDYFLRMARPRPLGKTLETTFTPAFRDPEGIIAARIRARNALTERDGPAYSSSRNTRDEENYGRVAAKVEC